MDFSKDIVMTKKTTAPVPANKSKTLEVEMQPGVSNRERMMANVVAQGLASNATTAMDFAKASFGELSLTEMVAALKEQTGRVTGGDMAGVEQVLVAQMLTMNVMFSELSRRAALNMGTYLDPTEKYLRLALKAQSQCRATAETLAVIKNPPIFAKQANIAHGPQQVNNGTSFETSTHGRAHAGESATQQNELLEDQRDGSTYVDTGTAPAAARSHQAVATVATSDRTKKRGGQGRDES